MIRLPILLTSYIRPLFFFFHSLVPHVTIAINTIYKARSLMPAHAYLPFSLNTFVKSALLSKMNCSLSSYLPQQCILFTL
ncbi:hypothetical protein BDB00DRAFT_845913 [Zychaea mexicana]|uniref:uncharacterized protein n=1 Tax=Zychaea mexicana TaxID=64656 RepID=UPI0022FDF487|nr:uncharacterized protein BDB00DRAFT_845913 [Zychaea mexicana]KAI9488954.1 hypothetical protein BDB00DRAFT_845913 [Zychaea mexicana]